MKKLFLFVLLVQAIAYGQESVQVDLSSPNATVYTHLYFLQPDSYAPEKAASAMFPLQGEDAVNKAVQLKQILDGKGLFVDFNSIPKDKNFKDSISGFSVVSKFVLFPDALPEIYVEKSGTNWYYSKETVQKLDDLYDQVFPWYVVKMEQLVPNIGHKEVFGVEVWKLLMIVIFVLIAVLIQWLSKKIIYVVLQNSYDRFFKDTDETIGTVLKKLAHPISLLIAIGFLEKLIPSLRFELAVNTWLFLALGMAATIFWIYVFLQLVKVVMHIYAGFTARTHGKLDEQLVPILRNFLTGIVLFLGLLKLLTLFGIDTATVIAGASIGGLAVALASQDTVKNLIGTTMIFIDKPFHIGDWIEAGEVVGAVEQVGFRSSIIRAADTSIFQIPNSKLSELVINNKGLRLYRRYHTNLGLRYDTPPELIEAFVTGLRELIVAHPETRSEAYNVEFTGFGDSALLIMINVYFKQLEWGAEQSSKHRLHIAILHLAKNLGVDFAFPSSTLMIEQFPDKTPFSMKYDTDANRMQTAIQSTLNQFKSDSPSAS